MNITQIQIDNDIKTIKNNLDEYELRDLNIFLQDVRNLLTYKNMSINMLGIYTALRACNDGEVFTNKIKVNKYGFDRYKDCKDLMQTIKNVCENKDNGIKMQGSQTYFWDICTGDDIKNNDKVALLASELKRIAQELGQKLGKMEFKEAYYMFQDYDHEDDFMDFVKWYL